MTQDTKLLGFIVGMSRSGTTWLSNSLNAHPSVAVFGETGFWGKMYIVPKGQTYCPDDYHSFSALLGLNFSEFIRVLALSSRVVAVVAFSPGNPGVFRSHCQIWC